MNASIMVREGTGALKGERCDACYVIREHVWQVDCGAPSLLPQVRTIRIPKR